MLCCQQLSFKSGVLSFSEGKSQAVGFGSGMNSNHCRSTARVLMLIAAFRFERFVFGEWMCPR